MSSRAWFPVLLALPALAAPAVQGPRAPWVTFTTPHYRIHCPQAFEGFGKEVAGRVEGVHAQYLGLVGHAYGKPIDILILDPVLEANGLALPLLPRPHVVLWKTEPEPDSPIGHHRGWAELLLTHELGHMHHLLWPARKPGLWERWTGVLGPLARKCPRWVTEGYATVIEGKLTGSGRPHSAIRAAVLRQWAMEGRLPTYEDLSGADGFLGGSMAYLGGSAYLEWLERRAQDPKILQGLWTRLAGRRDFDAAFLATFGVGPKEGYQRFCAELTHTALELERKTRAEGLREGEVFARVNGWATDLAVSPDGARLMARVLDPKRPGVFVWNLAAPPKPKPKGDLDPDEPADHAPRVPTREPDLRLGRVNGAVPWKPRWLSGESLVLCLRLPDGEGVLQPEPFRWTFGKGLSPASVSPPPATNQELGWAEINGVWNLTDAAGRPLTRTLAAAWNPAPTPDGRWIYYTQLSAQGVEIRRLDRSLGSLEAKPLPTDPAALVPDAALPKPDEPSPLPPPAEAPPPHPYRVGETHKVISLGGYSATPSGLSAQVGVGGNDILGRLNWQVLAGLGDGAGPRGGMGGVAWRGWAWAPSLQAFSLLERPSAQRLDPVMGFDRERRGVELAFTREALGRPQADLIPSFAFERVAPSEGPSLGRSIFGLAGHLGSFWSRDEQGLRLGATATLQEGRSDRQSWSLMRGTVSVGWINPWMPLSLLAETGRVSGDPTTLDRFHLGGVPTSLLPASLDANRIQQAALPSYTLTGDRLQRLRGDLQLGILSAYLEHSTVWNAGTGRPGAQRVAGMELSSARLGLPLDLLRRLTGNLTFTLGVHRPLDGVMKGRTVGTLSILLRP